MILRYFYISQYNGREEHLNVNFGGAYKFQYDCKKAVLYINKNREYAEKLYDIFPNVSDVSAILGKNGAGKTSVLRMINDIFNGLQNPLLDKENYIIIFEANNNRYIACTKLRIDHIDNGGCCDISRISQETMQKKFEDVGLIYFSGIFDKATPFTQNANLIDISTNSSFKRFCKDTTINDPERNILDLYRASNIYEEIQFHIAFNRDYMKKGMKLLFEVPKEVEIGFFYNLEMIDKVPDKKLIDKSLEKLKETANKTEEYFITQQENVQNFLNETILFFIYDEIFKEILEDKYKTDDILAKIDEKMSQNNWDIQSYYPEILNSLFRRKLEEDSINEDAEKYILTYTDILQKIWEIVDDLSALDVVDWDEAGFQELFPLLSFTCRNPGSTGTICRSSMKS